MIGLSVDRSRLFLFLLLFEVRERAFIRCEALPWGFEDDDEDDDEDENKDDDFPWGGSS